MNKVVEVGSTIVALDEDLHHDRMVKIGENIKQTEEGDYLIADEDLAYLIAVGHILQGIIQEEKPEDKDPVYIPRLIH